MTALLEKFFLIIKIFKSRVLWMLFMHSSTWKMYRQNCTSSWNSYFSKSKQISTGSLEESSLKTLLQEVAQRSTVFKTTVHEGEEEEFDQEAAEDVEEEDHDYQQVSYLG